MFLVSLLIESLWPPMPVCFCLYFIQQAFHPMNRDQYLALRPTMPTSRVTKRMYTFACIWYSEISTQRTVTRSPICWDRLYSALACQSSGRCYGLLRWAQSGTHWEISFNLYMARMVWRFRYAFLSLSPSTLHWPWLQEISSMICLKMKKTAKSYLWHHQLRHHCPCLLQQLDNCSSSFLFTGAGFSANYAALDSRYCLPCLLSSFLFFYVSLTKD